MSADEGRPAHLPPPLAKPMTPRWFGQKVENLMWALIGGHIVRWNWIFIYFVLTQNGLVRPVWNTLLDGALGVSLWTVVRHFARAGVESQLTSATLWVVLANPFTLLKPQKELHGFKRFLRGLLVPSWLMWILEHLGIPTPRKYQESQNLRWWQWVFMMPSLAISAIPGYMMGIGIYFLVTFVGHHFGVHIPFDYSHYPSFVRQDVDAFAGSWQYTLAGVLGTVFYSRLVFKVYAIELMKILATQLAAIHQRATESGQKTKAWFTAARWPLPVGFRAVFRIANKEPARYRRSIKLITMVLIPCVIIGAVGGYVVITYVAIGSLHIPGFS